MPELPERPDLDQLRRQARELLRAAVVGEPHAIARIHAVSPQLTLSGAQLALAREYGCRSWPTLRAEAQRRRALALAGNQPPGDSAVPGPPPAFQHRWSFGGAEPIETLTGLLLPEGLVAGHGRAELFAVLAPAESALDAIAPGWRSGGLPAGLDREPGSPAPDDFDEELRVLQALARIGDIAAVDDQGTRYAMRRISTSGLIRFGPEPVRMRFRVDPAPGQAVRWIEFSGQGDSVARLLPSGRASARIGQAAALTGNPVERELARRARMAIAHWIDVPAGTGDHADGPRYHIDLGVTVPPVDGVTVRLDALISAPGSWRLHLCIAPRWPIEARRDGNGNLKEKWRTMEIGASDDRGNSYVGSAGGSGQHDRGNAFTEHSLEFQPRLDPLARNLRLTVTGATEQVAIDIDLGPAEPS